MSRNANSVSRESSEALACVCIWPGTIGKEILSQAKKLLSVEDNLDAVFVPVGGGGLAAGIGAYIKFINPRVKVIGVEAADSAGL